MSCLGFVACLCLTAVAAPTPTARAQKKENLEKRDTLELQRVVLVRGELRVKSKGEEAWRFRSVWRVRQTTQGMLICLSQWNHDKNTGWDGWYLNYDHRGKDNRLGLVREPGPGCYWKWKEGGWNRQGIEGYEFHCTARALNGPMRGWWLAFQDDKLVLTNEGDEEVRFRGWVDNLDDGK